jgi:hypothetical protein
MTLSTAHTIEQERLFLTRIAQMDAEAKKRSGHCDSKAWSRRGAMTRVWPEGAAKHPSARPNTSEFGCKALAFVSFAGAIAAPVTQFVHD